MPLGNGSKFIAMQLSHEGGTDRLASYMKTFEHVDYYINLKPRTKSRGGIESQPLSHALSHTPASPSANGLSKDRVVMGARAEWGANSHLLERDTQTALYLALLLARGPVEVRCTTPAHYTS